MPNCRRNLGLSALVAWVIVQSPRVAEACAVCTAGRDEENQAAFLWSTLFMSLLPLISIGTLVFVIRRRYQKLEAETAARELAPTRATTITPTITPKMKHSSASRTPGIV